MRRRRVVDAVARAAVPRCAAMVLSVGLLGPTPAVRGAEPEVFTESVEVTSTPIYPTWRQFVVRDTAGNPPDRALAADAFRVTLRSRDGGEVLVPSEAVHVRLSTKPVSLSIIVDRSSSMRGQASATVACVRECLLRLRDQDRVRLATFATDQRSTSGYIRVAEYKTAAVVHHVRLTLRRDPHPPWLRGRDAASIGAMTRAERATLGVERIASLTAGLTPGEWVALQGAALDTVLGEEFRNGGATLGFGVLEGAMQALIEPLPGDFIAALDSNAGMLIITDDPRALPMDDLASALLRVLVVQACVVTPPGAAAVHFPAYGTSARLLEGDAEELAGRFIARLRHVHEVELDLPDLQYTRPGAVKIELADSSRWRVIVPAESLPTRDAIRAELVAEPAGRSTRAQHRPQRADILATESPSAQTVLSVLRRRVRGD